MSERNKRIFLKYQGFTILTLVIFFSVALFFNLGKRSFWEPDEGRYAEISREMVESGNWLTPRLNYIKHFDKPPITYWLIGSSFKLFGQNEFAGHLPLAFLGLGAILITYFLGKSLSDSHSGFLSAIILASSLGHPALSRVLSTDIVFTFFCLLCYLSFIKKKHLLFFVFMALGFMTKGPVVFVITLLPICIFLIYEKDKSTLKKICWGRGLLLFIIISFPWFIYQILLNQGLLNDWVVQQTLNRVVRETQQPFYFFIPVLIGLFFPWIFFLGPALKGKLYFKRGSFEEEHTKILFVFFWFILPFIFFSCIGKKLVPYILPLLPSLAIITGRFWNEVIDEPRMLRSKFFVISFYLFILCLAILSMGMIVFLSFDFDQKFNVQAARPNIIFMSVILTCALLVSLVFFKTKKPLRLFWVITITSLLFFLTSIELLPKIETNISKSVKGLALRIKEDLEPEDKVVNYRCFLKSLPFYLSRRTIVVERERNLAYEKEPHWKEFLLKDKRELYRLLSVKDYKVFCITYTWEFEDIRKDYPQPLYLLDKAGKYVLFVNRMSPKLTE